MVEKFTESVNNDLNTAQGVASLWELLKDDAVSLADKKATALAFDKVLGLDLDKMDFAVTFSLSDVPKEISDIVAEREDARKKKDWKMSDELRDVLKMRGYEIKDTDQGPVVHKK